MTIVLVLGDVNAVRAAADADAVATRFRGVIVTAPADDTETPGGGPAAGLLAGDP